MKTDTTYNGWTNQPTWNISLLYQETFDHTTIEQQEDRSIENVEQLAEVFQSIVEESELEPINNQGLAYWVLDRYLSEVNWLEIAKHYAANWNLFGVAEEDAANFYAAE
jgi:thiamine biosynthesis lipoprotein ApbE